MKHFNIKRKIVIIIIKSICTIVILFTLFVRIIETLLIMWNKSRYDNFVDSYLLTDLPNFVSIIVLVYVMFIIWKNTKHKIKL
jgi:hypothetical protein